VARRDRSSPRRRPNLIFVPVSQRSNSFRGSSKKLQSKLAMPSTYNNSPTQSTSSAQQLRRLRRPLLRSHFGASSPDRPCPKRHFIRRPSCPRLYVPPQDDTIYRLPANHRCQAWVPLRRPPWTFSRTPLHRQRKLCSQSINGHYYYSCHRHRSSRAFLPALHLTYAPARTYIYPKWFGWARAYRGSSQYEFTLPLRKPVQVQRICHAYRLSTVSSDASITVNPARIAKDARSNCDGCVTISKALSHFYKGWRNDPHFRLKLYWYPRPTREFVFNGKSLGHPLRFKFFSITKDEADASIMKLRRSSGMWRNLGNLADVAAPSPLTSSNAKILSWVRDCNENHPECSSEVTTLPYRVIDVDPEEPLNVRDSRLSQSLRTRARYVTLSHCWGPDLQAIPKTTRGNLQRRLREISWRSLCKTFQDAIDVTRSLGVRYIWIDSLCIIQDDDVDWNEQSALMKDIYGNSYLTIAATASKDGSGGLFVQRKNEAYCISLTKSRPLECHKSTSQDSVALGVGCREVYFHGYELYPHGHEAYSHDSRMTEPLLRRAWAYQERILSQRVIQYTSEELIWECGTRTICECGLEEYWASVDEEKKPFSIVKSYKKGRTNLPTRGFLTATWHKIISRYSSLNLTYPSDKLPAFSGIASFFVDPDKYFAGLREDHISIDLDWYAVSCGGGERVRPYRAPSWSWASMDGITATNAIVEGEEHIPLVSLVEASCTTEGRDSFGKVLAGHLLLEGYIENRTLAACKDVFFWKPSDHFFPEKAYWERFYPDCFSEYILIDDEEPILFLFVNGRLINSGHLTRKRLILFNALVLRKLPEENVYERIGVAHTNSLEFTFAKSQRWLHRALAAKFEWKRVKII
jgi:hypothetical protein